MNEFGCEPWTGAVDSGGYGIEWRGRTPVKAYLVVWQRKHGPVPDGLTLDHTCRNRACTADRHLEPVTRHENELRKSYAYRCRIKKCPRGHDLNLKLNRVATPQGGYGCRQCNRDAKEGR